MPRLPGATFDADVEGLPTLSEEHPLLRKDTGLTGIRTPFARRLSRGSVASSESDHERFGTLRAAILQNLYVRKNPCEHLTGSWMAGGAKLDLGVEEDEEALEFSGAAADAKDSAGGVGFMDGASLEGFEEAVAEATRRERQLETCDGYKTWLLVREMRANLALPASSPSKPRRGAERELRGQAAVGWYRCPADPSMPDGMHWCWRSDFVAEARVASQAFGLRDATVGLAEAERLLRKRPGAMQLLNEHVEVTSTDGRGELWSRGFLRVLEAMHFKRGRSGDVRLTLEQLQQRAGEGAWHLARPDIWPHALDSPRARKALSVPVPELAARGLPPAVPRLPLRMPYAIPYKRDAAWMSFEERFRLLVNRPDGAASDSSQRAAFGHSSAEMPFFTPFGENTDVSSRSSSRAATPSRPVLRRRVSWAATVPSSPGLHS